MRLVAEIRRRLSRVSPNVRGMLWMALAGLIFASFMAIVRHVGTTMHPIQAAFLRYALGMAFMLPFFLRLNMADLRSARFGLHAARGVMHAVGVMAWFYAMSRIPIAEVTAIGFTAPVFAVLGAALFLGERIRARRIAAVAAGLLGAAVILRPGFVEIDPGAIAMLVAAPIFAAADLVSKVLTRRETGAAVVAYLSVFVTLTILGPALYVWKTPTAEEWVLLATTAGLATLGHLCMVRGVKIAEVSALQPVKFLQLFWAALIGYLAFAETPALATWIGSAIVVASTAYIARREALARDRGGRDGPAGLDSPAGRAEPKGRTGMERTDKRRVFPAAAGAGLALALALAPAGPARADAAGVWLTAGGESRVAIAPCEDKLCGKIVWLKEPLMPDGSPKADLLNEDEALRGRPALGLRILAGFVPDGDGKWTDGQVYSLRAGKSFDAELTLSAPNTLEVEACAFLFSCRTQTWTRVE